MPRSLFGKTLWEQRRALVWWSVGILLLVITAVGFYPSIRDRGGELQALLDEMPESLRVLFVGQLTDITSPPGYLNSQVFATLAPILFLVYSIGAGARAVAGEERRGTLELLLATPLPRRRLVLEKLGGMAVGLLTLSSVMLVGLALGGPPVALRVPLGDLAGTIALSALFGLGAGTIALAVGCLTGSRGAAIGLASGIATAAFLLYSLAPIADGLRWLEKLSLFYYANGSTPIVNGFDAGHALVLLAVTGAAAVLATLGFERRDIAT